MSEQPIQPDLFSQTAPPASGEAVLPVLTVTQLVRRISGVLETHLPASLHVVGEISNLKRHTSGHLYLSLKDAGGEIRAVMWRSDAGRLKFRPTDGLEVVATGQVTLFEQRGQVQFLIRRLEPRGVGALELAFRQLCDKLRREGLFEAGRRRTLPAFPSLIAVVTSPTGAAVRDIIRTLGRRYPLARVLVYPVLVQGEGAAEQIAAAIRRLNAESAGLGGIDVMIVGRGGGSLEDLWAFNEEVVARAIFHSRIPVISAVGHETDVTVADFVADVRAATPTAAAELATPAADELLEQLHASAQRLVHSVRAMLSSGRGRLDRCAACAWFRRPQDVLGQRQQQLDETQARLALGWATRLSALRGRLHRAEVGLVRHRPEMLLARTLSRLHERGFRLRAAAERRLRRGETRLSVIAERLAGLSPGRRVPIERDRLAGLLSRVEQAARHRLSLSIQATGALEKRLRAGSHEQVLRRGFSITRLAGPGTILRRADQAAPGEALVTRLSEGQVESIVSATVEEKERESRAPAGKAHIQAGDGEA